MRGSSKNTVQNDNIIHIVASIVDNLPQGITVTDSDGLIIYVNSSAERISGYTRDELIGKHLEVLNWEKDNETCFRKVFSGILHSGGWRGEILQRHKDGRSFLSHLEISPVSGSGETVAWVCAQREITTARQTRQQELISDALRESEKRYRSLVEQIPAITYIALPDDASTPIYVSPQVERYLSISSSHYLSSPDIWRRHLHPDDRRRVLDDLQQCHTTNQRFLSEYRMLSADGRVVWFHDEAVLIRDENGNPQYLQGVKYDITKQKQTQEALRKSAEQHRLIVETANEGICMVDADDKISFINKQLVEMIGFTKDELLGKSVFDFFDDNGKAFVSEALRRRRQGLREQVDLKYPGKDGRDIFLLVSVSPVIDNEGNYAGTLAMVTDISDRQQYENDLRLSEERFSKAFKSNPNPMSITTIKEGRYTAINESFIQLTGYSREKVIGRLATELNIFANPDDRFKLREMLTQTGVCRNLEVILRKKTGDLVVGLASAEIIEINGEPCILGTFNDITNRKKTEEALRLSEEKFSKVFNLSPGLLVITTLEGKYLDVNKNFLQTTGYSKEEIIGRTATDIDLYVEPSIRSDQMPDFLKNRAIHNQEVSYRMKSGEIRVGMSSAELIDLGGEPCILAIVFDITEKKRMEKEMARLERLNLVGEMAAGIGHEIRNPMTAVRGFLQMLRHKEECNRYLNYFNLMIEELDRANSIISEFLSMAKNKPVDLKNANINSVINKLFPLIQADALNMNENVSLDLGVIPVIPLDEKEIRQLILNLVKNGLESMEPGKTLTIRTSLDNGNIVLSVQDQGSGIGQDLIDKVGTPFWTTKENGTGLGLAVCYGIATRHNASITLDTGPGGTTFSVSFSPQDNSIHC